MRFFANGICHSLHHGGNDISHAFFQHQSIGKVIDIFRGAGEMHKLHDGCELTVFCELFLEVVLNGLDVMVGHGLLVLDDGGFRFTESFNQIFKESVGGFGQGRTSVMPGLAARRWSQRISTMTR